MKMKMPYVKLCIIVSLLFAVETQVSMAKVTCNALELSACASAITSSTPPTSLCCSKLKQQRPCLCHYLKDPNLQKLVNSPNARKVANACGSPFPSC
ncbi:non-specific lipid-transfer protein 2-like [Senna tora]|uniref:Non-specific lipid-transfer protein 2-like n=1 Tax=Senna tora TaxID=362788 RepID=A0A834TT97_9FABA|nr:non-specific lipid-transfer protein 2-like [Senna tora]